MYFPVKLKFNFFLNLAKAWVIVSICCSQLWYSELSHVIEFFTAYFVITLMHLTKSSLKVNFVINKGKPSHHYQIVRVNLFFNIK